MEADCYLLPQRKIRGDVLYWEDNGKNGDIVLQIVEVRGSQVRIGIQAPSDIPVHREEVFARIGEAATIEES